MEFCRIILCCRQWMYKLGMNRLLMVGMDSVGRRACFHVLYLMGLGGGYRSAIIEWWSGFNRPYGLILLPSHYKLTHGMDSWRFWLRPFPSIEKSEVIEGRQSVGPTQWGRQHLWRERMGDILGQDPSSDSEQYISNQIIWAIQHGNSPFSPPIHAE